MSLKFQPLEPGEPIGVAALSGPVDPVGLNAGLEVLREWGHPTLLAANLTREEDYLAGTDEQRLDGLLETIDRGARWILAARGGYGATRLLHGVPWRELAKRRVGFVGFSDMTAILNPMVRTGGAPQVHGPMVAAGLKRRRNAVRLRNLLEGNLVGQPLFRFPERSVVVHGTATGMAIGGNLSLLVALLGTDWEPDFDGSVLFLEEVGEPLYRLDRMLTHLRSSGRLRHVKALIGGSLRGCRPASDRAGSWSRMLEEAAPSGAPVVADLPFGHGAVNLAFPIGAEVEVDTRAGRVMWS